MHRRLVVLLVVALAGLVGATGWFYWQLREAGKPDVPEVVFEGRSGPVVPESTYWIRPIEATGGEGGGPVYPSGVAEYKLRGRLHRAAWKSDQGDLMVPLQIEDGRGQVLGEVTVAEVPTVWQGQRVVSLTKTTVRGEGDSRRVSTQSSLTSVEEAVAYYQEKVGSVVEVTMVAGTTGEAMAGYLDQLGETVQIRGGKRLCECYVSFSDGTNATISPIWHFTPGLDPSILQVYTGSGGVPLASQAIVEHLNRPGV